ncbi:MAG: Gfo/Idh/MocA family oxidoreductase [Myxococcota bacterium]
MTRLRVAVVGAGPMGRLHARTVRRSAERDGDCELVCIVDRHLARAAALAETFGGRSVDTLADLRDVDAAVVAVPTAGHVETGLALVESGLDVLMEKPLALDARSGERLVTRAEAMNRILQVGHVEWYNPVWRDALARAGRPRRVRVERLQPPSERGLDVDVIQDLMLHDLDWVTRALGDELETFSARGIAGRGGDLDEADVELRLRSGCVASLRASRVHAVRERWLAIEGCEASVRVDLLAAIAPGREPTGLDPLGRQWRDFVSAVAMRKPPVNDGRIGLAALRLVERIRGRIGAAGAEGEGGDDSPLGG